MKYFHYILDSDSDDDIGWSKTKDLPQSRHSRSIRQLETIADVNQPSTSSAIFVEPPAKRIKLEQRDEEESEEEKTKRRRNIANWPEDILKMLIQYIPIDGRIKLRCMCRSLRDAVDAQPMMLNHEVDIRRLDETEIGLFVAQDEKEGQFVIANKKFTWNERPLLRTFREMRRGVVEWTRHHRNRMGRIKTAVRAMFKLSQLHKITISQVNLSNSFLRDINRVLSGQQIHSLCLECQLYEYDRPDLTLLNNVHGQSISIAVRLKDREPLPQIERFLADAKDKFSQIVIEVRQDSWKFHSTMHYRKSYEDYGFNNAALIKLMEGKTLNFIRFKFVCRFVRKDGIMGIIKFLRGLRSELPSRGFCVVIYREEAKGVYDSIKKLPHFGKVIPYTPFDMEMPARYERFPCHNTDEEYLEVRPVRQEESKPPLSEVRYWRKGNDDHVPYFVKRVDSNGRWDPFEQPRWKNRPI
ncbi:hypothetical protein PENTCL1PPCAC_29387 [Pristionchus entomophagus]|uniref:F-box domain-containing protein n=1 Tax=Pristionchus entomophagus TaxID=358040 RepID=A0AAV5ULM5_9BILA|nr:hypothetical protein PENTCL1PPCAC_29387 [Pristionchus entomophagus]